MEIINYTSGNEGQDDWKYMTKRDPGEAAEEVAEKQDVTVSRIGRSDTFTIKAGDVLKC